MSIFKNSKFLCIVLFVVPIFVLALAIGLTVGLGNANKKTISFETSENGGIYVVGNVATKNSDGTYSIKKYSDFEIVVVPKNGYKISKIFVNEKEIEVSTADGDRQYVQIDRLSDDLKVSAQYELRSYEISTSAGENGTITETFHAKFGETKTVLVTPNSNYKISKITVDGQDVEVTAGDGESQIVTLENISSKHNISASFSPIEFEIAKNVINPEGGVVDVQTKSAFGEQVLVIVSKNAGYNIKTVVVKANGITVPVSSQTELSGIYVFTMPAGNVVVEVEFEKIQYSIQKETEESTYSVSKTTGVVGEEITITTSPQEGYMVDQIVVKSGELAIVVAEGKFIMPAGNVTVKVTFKKIDYSISKVEAENGTFSVPTTAQINDVVEIIINPSAGFVLGTISVKKGDETIAVSAENKFIMPAGDVQVTVTFVAE